MLLAKLAFLPRDQFPGIGHDAIESSEDAGRDTSAAARVASVLAAGVEKKALIEVWASLPGAELLVFGACRMQEGGSAARSTQGSRNIVSRVTFPSAPWVWQDVAAGFLRAAFAGACWPEAMLLAGGSSDVLYFHTPPAQ